MIAEIGAGVLLLEMPASSDERGSFIKLADFRLDEIRRFEQRQLNYVVNKHKFTCRGLHYQPGEFAESKIFRVLQGSIQLVLVNVDSTSHFYKLTYSQLIERPELAVLRAPRTRSFRRRVIRDSCRHLRECEPPGIA